MLSARACYAVCSGSRSRTPYQAECGVLSAVYLCRGLHSLLQGKRKMAPHFCVLYWPPEPRLHVCWPYDY